MNQDDALTQWLAAFGAAVSAGEFVKLGLAKPTSAAGDLKSIDARPILVKGELKLSFTSHHRTRDVVKNYGLEESSALIGDLLNGKFDSGRLYTLAADLSLARHAVGFKLTRAPASQRQLPELSHNRAKHRFVESAGRPYLHRLGITDAQGKVRKNSQDKFRQINKYIEILDVLVKQLDTAKRLRIIDMGAGKGYLTFALYDYIANTLKLDVEVQGVEQREDLVNLCNDLAVSEKFENLRFARGSIAKHDCSGADVVIALHACDTATDDAISKAIAAQARLIVVAPCCHKQIRREMEHGRGAHSLGVLLRHGTYVERMAEMVTDGLRAELMELQGYKTKLFEFISDAHTPKNVMIVGQRLDRARKAEDVERLRAGIAATKAQFGIETHALERLLARS
jgi:Methyltransferase domain